MRRTIRDARHICPSISFNRKSVFSKEVISCFVEAQLSYSEGDTPDKRLEHLDAACYEEALKCRKELINRRVSWALERRLSAARLSPKKLDNRDTETLNAFSKLKAFLRKAAARTIDDLWDVIRDALPTFTPQDCASYFTAAGYEPE